MEVRTTCSPRVTSLRYVAAGNALSLEGHRPVFHTSSYPAECSRKNMDVCARALLGGKTIGMLLLMYRRVCVYV